MVEHLEILGDISTVLDGLTEIREVDMVHGLCSGQSPSRVADEQPLQHVTPTGGQLGDNLGTETG